jgi:SAM-dependent methyltransferase
MKSFWDAKAREDARYYIATWFGYNKPATEDFFETSDDIIDLLQQHGCYPPPGGRMLEIGCGIGRMTRGFAQVFEEVDAIDVSAEMVRQASQNLQAFTNVRVHETNGTDLARFDGGRFDFCFCFLVFQHIPTYAITRNYILEVGRVLKPGGRFLFQVNNLTANDHPFDVKRVLSTFWQRKGRPAFDALRSRVMGGPQDLDHPVWLGPALTVSQVESAVASAGLELQSMTGHGTLYLWVHAAKPTRSRLPTAR